MMSERLIKGLTNSVRGGKETELGMNLCFPYSELPLLTMVSCNAFVYNPLPKHLARYSDTVMSQISDSLWQIIKSNDGMKSEIKETVQSVYDKLANPKGKNEVLLSASDVLPSQRQGETALVTEIADTMNENEPKEPPGFTLLRNHVNNNNHKDQVKGKVQLQRQQFSAEQKGDSLSKPVHLQGCEGFDMMVDNKIWALFISEFLSERL